MIAALLLLAALTPEECLAVKAEAAATAVYAGKTYYLTSAECRDQFVSDPERYAQLYDALLELRAQGAAIEPPKESLVPS